MLVLTRKTEQTIHIGRRITVTVLRIKGRTVKIGIQAPLGTEVLRGELFEPDPDPQPQEVDLPSAPAVGTGVTPASDSALGADSSIATPARGAGVATSCPVRPSARRRSSDRVAPSTAGLSCHRNPAIGPSLGRRLSRSAKADRPLLFFTR